MYLPRMTSAEIEKAIGDGAHTAIVVAGSVEQHGPHLPCETDTLYGIELGLRLARRLGSALVAPVIAPGCSDHHLGFGGTFSIPAAALVAQVDAYLVNLAGMGFERVILTSSHGGNFAPLADAVETLQARARDLGLDLVPVLSLAAFIEALRKVPAERGLDQGIPAVQADLIETSIMLYLHPELVHMDRAEVGHLQSFDIDELFRTGLKSITANGVLGDPRQATSELGEAIVATLEDYLVSSVEVARTEGMTA